MTKRIDRASLHAHCMRTLNQCLRLYEKAGIDTTTAIADLIASERAAYETARINFRADQPDHWRYYWKFSAIASLKTIGMLNDRNA